MSDAAERSDHRANTTSPRGRPLTNKTAARMLVAFSALAFLALLVLGGKAADAAARPPDLSANATPQYAGKLSGNRAFVSMVSDGTNAIVYFCDGEGVSMWFRGAVSPDGSINLTHPSGARLTGRFTPTEFTGTLTGSSIDGSVKVDRSTTQSLYRIDEGSGTSRRLSGWVVLRNGQQVGATESGGTITGASAVDPTTGATTNSQFSATPVTGPVPPPPVGVSGCVAGAVLQTINNLASNGQPIALNLDGFASFNLGTLQGAGVCTDAMEISFTGASFSLFNGSLTGTDLSGTVTKSQGCFTTGTLAMKPEWNLPTATVGATPLCVRWDGSATATTSTGELCQSLNPVSGSVTFNAKFAQLRLPEDVVPTGTTIQLDCDRLRVTSGATLSPGGSITMTGVLTRAGDYNLAVNATNVPVLGSTLNGSGVVAGTFSGVTQASLDLTGTNLSITNGVTVNDVVLHISRDNDSTLSGLVDFNGKGQLHINGSYQDRDNWSFNAVAAPVGASAAQPITLFPNLSISSAQISGSIDRVKGDLGFNLTIATSGAYTPAPDIPFTLNDLTLQFTNQPALANGIPACPTAEGELVLAGSAKATVSPANATPITIDVAACTGVNTGTFRVASTVAFNNWKPLADANVTVGNLFIAFGKTNGANFQITFSGSITIRERTISVVGVTQTDGSIVFDAFGPLDGIAKGINGSGHVFVANKATSYTGTDTVLGTIQLERGVTIAAGVTLNTDVRDRLSRIGLPAPAAAQAVSRFTGAEVSLEFRIPLTTPTKIFSRCARGRATCPVAEENSLTLNTLSVKVGTEFGATGQGVLHLARPTNDAGPTDLLITLELAIDVRSAGFSVAITVDPSQNPGGVWSNALGINGLQLGTMALQGTVGPAPELGFSGTIVSLPQTWRDRLGIDTTELMRLSINVSATDPIFELTLGETNNQPFIKLLKGVRSTDTQKFVLDAASLVIAPFGGSIGTINYQPGMNLRFVSTIFGASVDVTGSVKFDPALNLTLDVATGKRGANGQFLLDAKGRRYIDTNFRDMRIIAPQLHLLVDQGTAKQFELEVSGGFEMPRNETDDGGALLNVALSAKLKTGATSGVDFSFDGQMANWQITDRVSIDDVHVIASGDVGGSTTNAPSVALSALVKVTVGSTQFNAAAAFDIQGGRLHSVAVNASGAVQVANLTINGRGCDPVSTADDNQACLAIAYNRFPTAGSPRLRTSFSGAIAVRGLQLAMVNGSFANDRVTASGTIDLGDFGAVNVNGDVFLKAQTLTTPIANDETGLQFSNVNAGDFRFAATTAVHTRAAKGFGADLTFTLGRLGGGFWIQGAGSMNIAESTVNVKGSFAKAGDPAAAADLTPASGGTPRALSPNRVVLPAISTSALNSLYTGTVPSTFTVARETTTAPPVALTALPGGNQAATVAPVSSLIGKQGFVALPGVLNGPMGPVGTSAPLVPNPSMTPTAPTPVQPDSAPVLAPTGTDVRFRLVGDGLLVIRGRQLADAHVEVDRNRVNVAAKVNLPRNASFVSVAGDLVFPTATSSMQFSLVGEAQIKDLFTHFGEGTGSTLNAKVTLSNSGFAAQLLFNSSWVNVTLNGLITTSGDLCAKGAAGITAPSISLDVSYCSAANLITGVPQGFYGRAQVGQFTIAGNMAAAGWSFDVTAPTTTRSFEVVIPRLNGKPAVVVGASFTYSLNLHVSNVDGFQLSGSGSALVYWRWPDQTVKHGIGVGVSVDQEKGACAVFDPPIVEAVRLCTGDGIRTQSSL